MEGAVAAVLGPRLGVLVAVLARVRGMAFGDEVKHVLDHLVRPRDEGEDQGSDEQRTNEPASPHASSLRRITAWVKSSGHDGRSHSHP